MMILFSSFFFAQLLIGFSKCVKCIAKFIMRNPNFPKSSSRKVQSPKREFSTQRSKRRSCSKTRRVCFVLLRIRERMRAHGVGIRDHARCVLNKEFGAAGAAARAARAAWQRGRRGRADDGHLLLFLQRRVLAPCCLLSLHRQTREL